jgi:hypothetical protein
MIQRGLDEEWVIDTMELGTLYQREDGRDVYEYQLDLGEEIVIIKIVVVEEKRLIVSIIDDTHEKGQ